MTTLTPITDPEPQKMWSLLAFVWFCLITAHYSIVLQKCPQLQSVQNIEGQRTLLVAISANYEPITTQTCVENFPSRTECINNDGNWDVTFEFDEEQCKLTNCSIQIYRNGSFIFASTCHPMSNGSFQFLGILLYERPVGANIPTIDLDSGHLLVHFLQSVVESPVLVSEGGAWNYALKQLICPKADLKSMQREKSVRVPLWVIAPLAAIGIFLSCLIYFYCI